MDSSFEQVISDHLKLKKRNGALTHGRNMRADEGEEVRALEQAETEQRPDTHGDLWAAGRDFEWGE
jgi:hypothetical protein